MKAIIIGADKNKTTTSTLTERRKYLDKLADTGKLNQGIYDYIIHHGVLTCPASTTHHGNYEGGLFDHCKAMYETLQEMTHKLGLNWESAQSPANVAWGHDVCKLDNYVRVNEMGKEDSFHYEYNPQVSLHGHGVKSALLLQQHATLTEEELYCIIYHMGAYEKDQWEAYDKAIRKYPNVLFTHTADMCASKILGV